MDLESTYFISFSRYVFVLQFKTIFSKSKHNRLANDCHSIHSKKLKNLKNGLVV